MVENGEDLTRITNDELEKFRLNFSRYTNRYVAPLNPSRYVCLSLCRRNEMLLANKPTIVRQAATTAGPEEEKIKKFATAIVEFSKVKII